jgi:histidinol-phosphate aminotransferase
MSRFFDLVSRPAREMGGYAPSAPQSSPSFADQQPRLIRLDSNENPFGPSPLAIQAMRSALASAHSYPDDDCRTLRAKLASHHDVPVEQILVTAGSTALLALLCQTMLAPGLNAVTSERSFIVYALATHAIGAQLIEAPMQGDAFDLEAILGAIDGSTRLVFLANPNNPTGTMLEAAAVENFLARVPEHVVAVLDEAYYEFAMHFASLRNIVYSKSLDYVRKGTGVVVLRTFSKAHGLAGLRVGYGVGPAELLAYCARMRNTFSVSSIAQTAALAAIDDQNYLGRIAVSNAVQAEVLMEGLLELGYRVIPTSANFLYCDVGDDAFLFARRLQREGVSVRPLGPWGAPSCVRVTIGLPEENQALLNSMRKLAGMRHQGV